MRDSGLVAVTKVTMRERESLAVLRVLGDLLVLQTLRWPDEIRPSAGIKVPTAEEPVHKNEIAMALQLAASMSKNYVLDDERDAYVVAMGELLTAKAGGGDVRSTEATAPAAPVVDLMAALQASIAESKEKRGETAPAKKPSTKTTAKKAPAKRAAPKRAS
ncbi:DNA end-binding protein Ku [Streptacidiphilus jiangxiensis]|uniref:DNA end-binding protein Ku n=1 Tax=Streptacidiphilus jiangxiensis TaxID=235985 RepID=A0A1H8ADP9_STRJI|nr:DNA end-binding protein Ku [Streptacidiphilus jiangxiensis]